MTTKPKPKPTPAIIKQINAAHEAVVESGQEGLRQAMRAGELLQSVKDGTDHGEWEDWLDTNCPDISPRTARLYMHLSKNEDKLTAAAEQNGNGVADLSIRGAQKLLAQPLTEEQKAARAATRDANRAKAEAEAAKSAASTDPAVVLQEIEASDIVDNIKDDLEKVEEVAAQSITRLTPDKVSAALTKAWPADQLRDLIKKLNAFVETLGAPPAPRRTTVALPEVRL